MGLTSTLFLRTSSVFITMIVLSNQIHAFFIRNKGKLVIAFVAFLDK